MSTYFVKWPATSQGETDAASYIEACNTELRAMTGNPEDVWYEAPAQDRWGQWFVALYGPPWEYQIGVTVEEPASCALARAGAIITSTPDWPPEEE